MIIFDTLLVIASVYISLLLRFDGRIDPTYYQAFIDLIPWFAVISLASLYFFRIYHRMWQYASLGELYSIVKAISTSMLIIVALIYTLPLPYLPRSVYIISWGLMIAFIGGSRLGWRILRDMIIKDISSVAKPTLIVGAGDAGALVAREMKNNQGLNLQAIGFIDDSRYKQNLSLYDIPVLGNRRAIPHIVEHYGIEEIIIAMPSASGRVIRELIEICQSTPAKLRIFQGTGDLLSRDNKIRNIELEDLLRREPVKLNLEEIAAYLTGKMTCKMTPKKFQDSLKN
jgi:FlaA1/EpsC-like NDP-sugar epimerase